MVNRKDSNRDLLPGTARLGRRYYRPRLEHLEDRTLLSVGSELNNIFQAMQTGLNGHLFQPSVLYSLPLLGKNLTLGSDTRAEFLSVLGQAVKSETNASNLQNDLNLGAASVIGPGSVNVTLPSGPSSSQDGEIHISRGTVPNLVEGFDLGLPGLESPNVSTYLSQLLQTVNKQINHINVNVNLTYDLNLFFNLDSGGNVLLDSSRNSSAPLVSLDLSATVQPFSFGEKLGPINVTLAPGPKGQLNFNALQFNVVQAPLGTFNGVSPPDFTGGNSTVTFANGASAVIDLALTVNMSPFPGLEADLDVTWTPGAGATKLFDNNAIGGNDIGQKDLKASFDVFLDLSTVTAFINPILDKIKAKLAPLANVVSDINHVLNDPIPILSDLIPGVTLAGLLSNPELNALAGTDLTAFGDLAKDIKILNSILNWLDQVLPGGKVLLASIPIFDADPRDPAFDLLSVVNNLTNPGDDPSSLAAINNLVAPLKNLLPGLQLPVLTDPLTDLRALLGENVVLVQSTIGFDIGFQTTLATIPIIPPLVLKIDVGFKVQGGLTFGYDTYGFTSNWNGDPSINPPLNPPTDPTNNFIFQNIAGGSSILADVLEGVFVSDAHLDLSGSVTLKADVDLVAVQIGAGGTLTLTFGIGGDATPNSPNGLNMGSLISRIRILIFGRS
jgi:hypothetical protein